MPAVDYERAMMRVRALVASKSSHGGAQLLREIAEIERECEIPEDQEGFDPRPALRRPALVGANGDTSESHDEPAEATA